jgi:hypothetical protein
VLDGLRGWSCRVFGLNLAIGFGGLEKVRVVITGKTEGRGYLDGAWGSVKAFPRGVRVLWDK